MQAKLVVIGAGWAGKFHAEAVRRHPQAQLAAVVDADEARCREIASAADGGAALFRSVEHLLEAGVPFDGAFVCTPPQTHIAISRKLVELGKHVFCEKPMGRSAADIEALIPLAEERGSIVGVNYNQRFSPALRELKARMAGEKTHIVHASMHQHGPVEPSGLVHEYFILTDACCHLIDTLMYLNGGVTEVQAIGAKIDSAIYSDVSVGMRFANGSVGSMTHTFVGGRLDSQHPFQRIDVSTSRARYTVDNLVDSLVIYPHGDAFSSRWSPSAFAQRDYGSTMLASVGAWIDSVAAGEPFSVDLRQAGRVAAVAEACAASLAQGAPVRLAQADGEVRRP